MERFGAGKGFLVVRIHVAQEVPRGAGPLGHGVGFALGRSAALRAGRVDPVGDLGDGRFAVVGRLIAFHLRQKQRKLLLRQRHPAARRAFHHRDRLAPVALTGEYPVAQLEVCLGMADTLVCDPFLHGGDGVLHGHAVEEAGVYHKAGIVLERKRFLGDIAALHDLNDRQTEFGGKLPVALVVAGNAHNSARTVAH